MTISIILVPTGVAEAAKAAAPVAVQGSMMCPVSTRLRDPRLLALALEDAGAAKVVVGADAIDATWPDLAARLQRGADGIRLARFTGTTDERRCAETVSAIDRAYGHRVQQEVLRKLRDRAPAAGMALVSETTNSDDSVTMILEVRQ
ncbi:MULTISPECIES: hypothetical protein [Nocardia]|uniref:hypothetical protein n=1 Tax=Nocardia TaxID=1817 RepID=UPI00142DE627|nr:MULTISPECIES: hypothetical protein [Nocardia]